MKKGKLILLSVLFYIIVLILVYITVAFIISEIDYRLWANIERAWVAVFGQFLSIIPILMLWMFNKTD